MKANMDKIGLVIIFVLLLGSPFLFLAPSQAVLCNSDDLVSVYRWYHPNEGWVTLAYGEISDERLKAGGYKDKKFQFYASRTGGPNKVPVYRWYHPDEGWVTLADGEISDERMTGGGYKDKKFQFWAWETSEPGMVSVSRWYHKADKDWVSLVEGEISDERMTEGGYSDKKFQFWAWKKCQELGVTPENPRGPE
jgi:hypothetical protein